MTDIWELARHVDRHPDDYKARWDLAKGLFKAEEYRLALEHLLVLKNEWIPKVNLLRYLAATYYRLGRYNDAIVELEEAVEAWPEEVGVLEQLARTLEVAGKRQEAIAAWEQIRKRMSDHPSIAEALARLNMESDAPVPEPAPSNVDSDLMAPPGSVCPNCGAQNSPAFERCWKCRTSLTPSSSSSTFTSPPAGPQRMRTTERSSTGPVWGIAGAVGAAALLAAGVYLSVKHLTFAHEQAAQLVTLRTVSGLLSVELMPARVAVGTAILVIWPIALWISLVFVGAREVRAFKVVVSGLFLASLEYVLFWLPGSLLAAMLVVPAVASLALVALGFGLRFGRAVMVWLVQGLFILFVGVMVLLVVEGTGPLREYVAILDYADEHDGAQNPGVFSVPAVRVPATLTIEWRSTGSAWLDERALRVDLLFEGNVQTAPVTVELRSDSRTVVYEHHESNPFKLTEEITPGTVYELALTGREGLQIAITVFGVLSPTVGS